MARVERFVASGTRVVINGKRPAQWFVTTRDVVVVDDRPAVCPIEKIPVRVIEQNGFRMFFPENLIRTRTAIEAGDIDTGMLANMRLVAMTYDIPDAVDFDNPSGFLRRFAYRFNGSCWIMNADDVPHNLIGRMLEAGCDPHVVRIDREDVEKMVGLAVSRLRDEIAARIKSAEKSQRDAERKLANAVATTGQTPEQAQKAYLKIAADVAARLAELTTDLGAAAARFGINPRVLEINRLSFAGNSIQNAMADRARAYLAAERAARAIGTTDGNAIANQLAESKMDPMVAADFLDDNGAAGGAELRAAFEPETFRLPGADEPDDADAA